MLQALLKLFRTVVRSGSLTLIDADGASHSVGDGSGEPIVVRITDKNLYRKLLFNPAFHLGESYMDGTMVIEQGDLRSFLELLLVNIRRRHPTSMRWLESVRMLMRRIRQYNPTPRARRNVAHHYDLDGTLYSLFLDSDKQYSCAYFEHEDASLEEAQHAKKRHIAAKLDLRPGQRILDIGSGWGGLALYLARQEDVSVKGITLSEEQHRVATARAEAEGLADRVTFHIEDYRHTTESFDRIVSVGMFEHVGIGHYQAYFDAVMRLLTDDGVALIHTIGRADGPGTTNPWLDKYIFPGGYVPALSEMFPAIERSGLFATDVEILRMHYAHTLRHWHERFMSAWETAAEIYDERFCRMWEFYLIGCEMSFKHQDINVFQVQLTKQLETLPITRDYMFDWERTRRARDAEQIAEGPRLAGE